MGTDSARALLERAATLNLQTGNLLSWGCGRKKCPATPSEEVSAALPAPGLPRGRGWGGGCGGAWGSARSPEAVPGLLAARWRPAGAEPSGAGPGSGCPRRPSDRRGRAGPPGGLGA